jgi:hypothetical protein
MNNKKVLFALGCLFLASLAAIRCTNNPTTQVTKNDSVIVPVPLPEKVRGFHFPEDSNKIYSWLTPYDSTDVYKHAWGVWAGLTAESGQTYQGDKLLVYQTWLGIADLQTLVQNNDTLTSAKKGRTLLTFPNQIKHANELQRKALTASAHIESSGIDTNAAGGNNFWVSVAYDPNAAKHVVNNQLLKQSVINKYYQKDGNGSIPAFPSNAITVKPVYFVGRKTDSLIRVNTWPGPPSPAKGFGPGAWKTYVYADVQNKQPRNKKLVPVTGENPSTAQIQAATCNLDEFIHFSIDAAMAAYITKQDSAVQGFSAHAGDLALLVAMHVTTKEISNWTWQTFFWSYDAANPFSPSSAKAAALRPSELSNAAAHYALSTAYTMVTPNQPIQGGTNKSASAMIGYNPYLEAGFPPNTFVFANELNKDFRYGIQTNCMSCHIFATSASAITYSTDQYIGLDNKFFKNKVQVDFAWSIQAAIIPDVPPKN